jgi:hypothetical protein
MQGTFELNPTLSFTLLGSCAIYAVTRPTRAVWATVALIALLLRAALVRLVGGLGAYYGAWWISWGAFFGLASILVLAGQAVRARARGDIPRHKVLRETFYAATVFPLLTLLVGDALRFITWMDPRTLDAFLLKFDGSLACQPSFLLGKALASVPNWWGSTTVIYYALPLGVGLLYASSLRSVREGQRAAVSILGLFLSLIAASVVVYAVFPATGPAHAYSRLYPWHSPRLSEIAVEPLPGGDALRNCMPSLHFAGALAVFWNARLWPRWGRALAGLFLLATAFATLALGEHYLVDLAVAFPFTLVFQAAWSTLIPLREPARYRALIGGTIFTLTWLIALRYGLRIFLITPLVSWAALILTVGWSWSSKRRLAMASRVSLDVVTA